MFILFYGYYCETFQYHPLILLINTKKTCTYIYHKMKNTHEKTVKSITFMKKTLKKTVVLRDFHVTETYCHIIVT